MRTSVKSNARINILCTGKDHLFERDSGLIFLTFILVVNILCEELAEKGLVSVWEHWETGEVSNRFKMRSGFDVGSSSWLWSRCLKFFLSLYHSFDTIIHVLN